MQTLILAYRGCILSEVIQAASFLDPVLAVKVATPDGDCFRDRSGVTVVPDFAYEEVSAGTIGCLLVPGGNPDTIAEDVHAKQIVREVLAGGGVVAGICAGVVVLALGRRRSRYRADARYRTGYGALSGTERCSSRLAWRWTGQ